MRAEAFSAGSAPTRLAEVSTEMPAPLPQEVSVPFETRTDPGGPVASEAHAGVAFPTMRLPRVTAAATVSECVADSRLWGRAAPPTPAMSVPLK